MSLITMRDVQFGFGGPLLLDDINFQISSGQRVCLVGRNGCGKSTFLKIISGQLQITGGEIAYRQQLRVGILDQTVRQDINGTVYDVVAEGLGRVGKLLIEYHRIAQKNSNSSDADARLMQLHDELEKQHSWPKLNVVDTVISKISLDADAKFAQLSAGLKRRALLGRGMAAEPDVLILDEPTNHLDIDTISWMEDFLIRSGITLLFVTHDRKFLKKLATRIIEIDRTRLYNWDCDYDTYLKRKAQSLNAEQQQWNKFDKKLAEEEQWIRTGIQARRTRNEGRVRALKKMRVERSQRKNLQGNIRIEINKSQRSGAIVVSTKNVSFAYDNLDENPVIKNLETTIIRGDRVGIIGPNGSGKTTLLQLLLGRLAPSSGQIKIGTNVQCAYFDQLAGQLDIEKSLYDNIGEGYDTITINGRKKQVIAYLLDFMFTPTKTKSPVYTLSGGERNRLQLAKVFTKPSNLLVLDEPTNDLDVETLELLEEMVSEFPGTVLIVSHDREFLNNIVTSTLVLEGDGVVGEYAGGYDDWLVQRKKPIEVEEKKAAKSQKSKSEKPKLKRLTYMQKRQLENLPDEIDALEARIVRLHEKMSEPEFYKQPGEVIAKTQSRLDELESSLSQSYDLWEKLAAMIE